MNDMCAASASARTHSNHKAKHSGTQTHNLQDPTGRPVKDLTATFGLCSSNKTHIMVYVDDHIFTGEEQEVNSIFTQIQNQEAQLEPRRQKPHYL